MDNSTSAFKIPKCYLKQFSVAFQDDYLKKTHLTVAPINALSFIISSTLNLLILGAVVKYSRVRTPSTVLLASIALKDVLLVSFLQPVAIYRSAMYLLSGNFCLKTSIDKYRLFVIFLYRSVALTTLVVISIDRWIAIRKGANYKRLVTKRRAYMSALLVWVFSLVISFVATFVLNLKQRYLLVLLQFGVTSIIVAIVQLSVYISIKRHGIAVGCNINSAQAKQDAIEQRIAVTVAYSVISLIICYLPIIVVSAIRYSGNNYFLLTSPWLGFVLYANAIGNPVLWLKTDRRIKRHVVAGLMRCLPSVEQIVPADGQSMDSVNSQRFP